MTATKLDMLIAEKEEKIEDLKGEIKAIKKVQKDLARKKKVTVKENKRPYIPLGGYENGNK